MDIGAVQVRIVVEHATRCLIARLAAVLEEAEMDAAGALLGEQLAARTGFETVIRHGCVRLALKPYAELMVLEIIDIATRPGLSIEIRESLVRQVMVNAGYGPTA